MPWISSTELWRLKRGNIDYKLVSDALESVQQSLTNLHLQYHTLEQKVDTMSKAIDDLNLAVTDITTAVNDYATAVAAEIAAIQAANQSGDQNDAIEAAVTNLKALTDTLKADTAAAQPPTT